MAAAKVGKTPRKVPSNQNTSNADPLQVYCRIKPLCSKDDELSCITIVSDSTIQLTPPDGCNPRSFNNKEVQYVFKKVFNEDISQKQIYTEVAHPLVANLIHGKNGLLLTYGVTGSGKTYTMTGSHSDGGIMVRCIDVLFNSMGKYQPRKRTFRPDKMNGFEVQSQADVLLHQQADMNNELIRQRTDLRTPGRGLRRNKSDPEMEPRVKDLSQVDDIDEDNVYSVFVSYIEIYNNYVHDLLEDDVNNGFGNNAGTKVNGRLIREDGDKNMYVHGANEIEVMSPEEAFQLFNKGQAKKRMGKTGCNKESSRSHSVFIIRLVQAPLDLEGETPLQDKRAMVVSQLCLVDLAGSERSARTQASSERSTEAGFINKSLMTLRTCLEVLRENQLNGSNKIPPYRDSKLTHLFKSYFSGEGHVRMIVCVNPSVEDYDENLAVMKFAEMSQEVQINKPLPTRLDFGLTPGRRRLNEATKNMRHILNEKKMETASSVAMASCGAMPLIDSGPLYSFPPFPRFDCLGYESRNQDLLVYLQARREKELELIADVEIKTSDFRRDLVKLEDRNRTMETEREMYIEQRDVYKDKLSGAQARVVELESRASTLTIKMEAERRAKDNAEKELDKCKATIERLKVMKERSEEKTKVTKTKLSAKFQNKMNQQAKSYEQQLKHNEKKVIRKVRNLIDSQLPDTSSLSSDSDRGSTAPVPTPRSLTSSGINTARTTRSGKSGEATMATPHVTTRRAPFSSMNTTNNTRRRSRSAGPPTGGGGWLHHTPGQVHLNSPHGTVFQPTGWGKRKSIAQLTDVKDIIDPKVAKYSLMTQEPTEDGDIETHLLKGDVLQTVGGGAQVVFNELETLRQTSPLCSPVKHRIAAFNARSTEDLENRCQMGLEGHTKKKK
uniref:Kinesin-like protein n=1 Tax=Cacopsylla melanoneura TaxID=428564 RepID=A0A8D8TAI2_9HEMI